jgi:hypothetical protein
LFENVYSGISNANDEKDEKHKSVIFVHCTFV